MTNELIIIRPSSELKEAIWEYRQEYFDFGETQINGSCGIAHANNFDVTWCQAPKLSSY